LVLFLVLSAPLQVYDAIDEASKELPRGEALDLDKERKVRMYSVVMIF
jgi:hypothetical protein